jgi:hypothetical protein
VVEEPQPNIATVRSVTIRSNLLDLDLIEALAQHQGRRRSGSDRALESRGSQPRAVRPSPSHLVDPHWGTAFQSTEQLRRQHAGLPC